MADVVLQADLYINAVYAAELKKMMRILSSDSVQNVTEIMNIVPITFSHMNIKNKVRKSDK